MQDSVADFVVVSLSDPNPNNLLRRKYAEKIKELKSWVNGQNDLDYYQFMAIRIETRTVSWVDYYRAITLILAQECAVLFVAFGKFKILTLDVDHGKDWCDGSGEFRTRYLGAVLSVVGMNMWFELVPSIGIIESLFIYIQLASCFTMESSYVPFTRPFSLLIYTLLHIK